MCSAEEGFAAFLMQHTRHIEEKPARTDVSLHLDWAAQAHKVPRAAAAVPPPCCPASLLQAEPPSPRPIP